MQNKTGLDKPYKLNGIENKIITYNHSTVQQLKYQSTSTKHGNCSELCANPIQVKHKYRRSTGGQTLSSGL